jgi:hypothetical protein
MTNPEFKNKYAREKNHITWARHPEKRKARTAAYFKVKIDNGTLCERCKKSLATERHHPDYNTPLIVRLLCKPCHTIEDKLMEIGE